MFESGRGLIVLSIACALFWLLDAGLLRQEASKVIAPAGLLFLGLGCLLRDRRSERDVSS